MEKDDVPTTSQLSKRYLELLKTDPKAAEDFLEQHKYNEDFASGVAFAKRSAKAAMRVIEERLSQN